MTYILRHSPFFSLMAELPPSITLSPQTLTPRPAPAALPSWSSEWGWGRALGQCGFWKAPLAPLIPSPLQVWQGWGPRKKRNEGQKGWEGHPCLAPGPMAGSGRRPPPTLLGFKVRWKPNGPSRRSQDTWQRNSPPPPPPQGPSPDSETQTLRGAGLHTDQVERARQPQADPDSQE